MLSVVINDEGRSELSLDLDELVCEGARRMLATALEAEVAAYVAAHAEEVDGQGIGWCAAMVTAGHVRC
jgi:hypothetical protein